MNYEELKSKINAIETEANKIIPNRSYEIQDMTRFKEYLERNTGYDTDSVNRREDFKEFVEPKIQELSSAAIKEGSRLSALKAKLPDLSNEERARYNEIVTIQAICKAYTSGLAHAATSIMTSYEARRGLIDEINSTINKINELNDEIKLTHDTFLIEQRKELETKLYNTQYGLITMFNKYTTTINKLIGDNELHQDRLLIGFESIKKIII